MSSSSSTPAPTLGQKLNEITDAFRKARKEEIQKVLAPMFGEFECRGIIAAKEGKTSVFIPREEFPDISRCLENYGYEPVNEVMVEHDMKVFLSFSNVYNENGKKIDIPGVQLHWIKK